MNGISEQTTLTTIMFLIPRVDLPGVPVHNCRCLCILKASKVPLSSHSTLLALSHQCVGWHVLPIWKLLAYFCIYTIESAQEAVPATVSVPHSVRSERGGECPILFCQSNFSPPSNFCLIPLLFFVCAITAVSVPLSPVLLYLYCD